MLWPLSVVLVANTNGRLAIPALAGLLVLFGYGCTSTSTSSGQIVGERGGTAFPFRFWRGERRSTVDRRHLSSSHVKS